MKNKSMFYGLMNYKDQAFYNEHSVALLVTPDAYYKIRFFSGYVSDTSADAWKLTFAEEEYSNWLRDIQRRSCFATDYAPTVEDKIITLSTCTYEFDDAKFVLHGYLAEIIEKKE
jgi:sortase B